MSNTKKGLLPGPGRCARCRRVANGAGDVARHGREQHEQEGRQADSLQKLGLGVARRNCALLSRRHHARSDRFQASLVAPLSRFVLMKMIF